MIDIHQLVKDSKLDNLDFTLSLLPDKRIHNHNFKYLLNILKQHQPPPNLNDKIVSNSNYLNLLCKA